MESTAHRAIAIVGVGAVLPDAPNAQVFWENVKAGRYSIGEVSPDRWDPALYYDPDHAAPDKTYSKIGGWVREHTWDPITWHLPIPPRVADAMDGSQKWGIACAREALQDYGYPKRPLDLDRTAVILGNAMGGEKHYFTVMRVYFPEYARELEASTSFASLPEPVRQKITRELHERMGLRLPEVTEDTMPGELANCIAGRIANIFNCHGPNYVVDAACASAMAAISSAMEGLVEHDFDAVITGGIDRNMGVSTFVKFSKIGALSATGTRPFAEGADGFVMGEGAAIFVMKRLADAERDQDKIYAVLRGMGGSSDGKGKGITAPNPIGQKFAVERAWQNAGLSPATVGLIEGHGTSTRVGDVVEVQSMSEVLKEFHLPSNSIALGSVKSNIGHLKGAAGAAGFLKAAMALHDKVLPPSVHCEHPNPDIDFAHSPLYVNTELRPWDVAADVTRRAGLSAFGFGGTNFHAVLEEYIPHKLNGNGKRSVAVGEMPVNMTNEVKMNTKDVVLSSASGSGKGPLRGALVIGAASSQEIAERLRTIQKTAQGGQEPGLAPPRATDLHASERLAIDYIDAADLAEKSSKALKALAADQSPIWKALRAQGIYRGSGPAPKVAFLYTGQGSQYVNMLRPLFNIDPIVAHTFAEADRIMTPLLGKPLTDFIFVNSSDPAAVAKAEDDLRQTEITQPAVLATDEALTRMLAAYGIKPDMTMGHSLGEYGALVASGAMPFEDALEAVSARGRGMASVAMDDNGKMAAVFAPLAEIERTLKAVNGNVVIANINSNNQAVIGGASKAVDEAIALFVKAGYEPVPIPVSHAFHTSIVAGAGVPLRKELERLHLQSPIIPIVGNVDGEFYPMGSDVVPKMLDILTRQVASPVQFVKGLRTLYAAGARVFVELGPKKALQGFAEDVLGGKGDVVSLFTNHPKIGDIAAFNQALCALYAAGLGQGVPAESGITDGVQASLATSTMAATSTPPVVSTNFETSPVPVSNTNRYAELGRIFADALERGWKVYHGDQTSPANTEPVTITGAAIGLPGTEHIFDDGNIARILGGEQFIDAIPTQFRRAMLDKHITRLVKSDNGGPVFESIHDIADVIKLAARGNAFDLEKQFGVPAERVAALDRVTQLAIAAGIDALRDAGIPLVMRYRTTSKGTQLPDHWGLPDALRDDTGIIFASAFPGYDSFADEMARYYADHARREELAMLEDLRTRASDGNGNGALVQEVDRHLQEVRRKIETEPYVFERRFLLKTLAMGHSQFAELIGVRGPNTQINSACASTAQAVGLAEDWIRAGRCRRVIVISADDVTSDHMLEWFGAGFLATGAAATDDVVENAAIPFDRRRHGMIVGMGAAALVVESADAARERGIQPICEVLSAVTANSAFHGTRLDVQHIGQVMEDLLAHAESRSGISRREIAPKTVFVSHETYTPARGGSASAEIYALRHVFGDVADQIVIANTKGFTGHAMATGIEDVVAVKALETGCVPPVANFKEVDPELGQLNLSKGGAYPVEYAIHLGAGFGSQISMILLRWSPLKDKSRRAPNATGYAYRITDASAWSSWLKQISHSPMTDLEVVNRTLRVPDKKAVAKTPQVRHEPEPLAVAKTQAVPAIAVVPPEPTIMTESQKANPEVPLSAPPSTMASVSKPQPDAVKERILALMVEKTGYPREMLDVDLDLEADLGVDTVKQAEMFAAIREIYNIPRDENRKLRDYPTLAHVIRFVYEKRSDLSNSVPAIAEQKPEIKGNSQPAKVGAPPSEAVKERILALVVEKTGYPKDMLDLDLDLEADLGVDTVKQAEMFAAIREIYNIPRDENRKLRDYPTLAHVIRFVYDKRPDLAGAPSESSSESKPKMVEAATVTSVPAITDKDDVKERVLNLVVEKTGYPKEMLDLDLDLEADLGVDTVKQAEMFAAIREVYKIPRDENRKLRDYPTLAHVIRFVYDKRPDLASATPQPPTEEKPKSSEPVPAVGDMPVSKDDVKDCVLTLVVEKTGYPKEMLDLDLDLEADLGVDTVKQAEMLAAIREIYHIPRDENRKLRDYPTLAHVIRFVYEKRPDLDGTATGVQPSGSSSVLPFPSPKATLPESAIQDKVLEIVAEKTGYPKDMLDLELDLEADLGIDTVKQAEMFASVRAAYNIPRDENMKLRDFPTLAHVIRFAVERSKAAADVSNPPDVVQERSLPSPVPLRPPLAGFNAANRIPRRVPTPVMRPPLGLCKATGVILGAGRRVVIMPDKGGVADALLGDLAKQGVETLLINDLHDPEVLGAQLKQWMSAGPIHGVYWLAALDFEDNLRDMNLSSWHEAMWVRLKALYHTMRALYEQVGTPGTFLVSATRLGGQHGYDERGALSPLGGAVTGFTKTFKRERTDSLVKTVDFEPETRPAEIAKLLIGETERDPGAVEVGYKTGLRWTIGLEERSAENGMPGLALNKNSVFVVTGAAGSIVSAITSDLAAASGGTFYLLDLVPEPDPKNPDLKRFTTDRDGLKRELFTRIQQRGERATPALVEKELAALERAQAAHAAIDAVRNAGGTAYYFSVNLTDADGVEKAIDQVRKLSGHVDVLLHAAGMERSHFLPDKDAREFDLVFDVKADGWFNLLHAIGDMPLSATVAFSSIAGRFGNAGQTDYSSANDLLCKITSSFRNTRPATRGIVIDWTAWGGIGMATRGSIPKMMEAAGIDMLPAEAGVPIIRRELTLGDTRGEVVIAQRLGALLNEWDPTGGVESSAGKEAPILHGPMTANLLSVRLDRGLTVETVLDPKAQPFLYDHKIQGTPVLPGVMGVEAFAEAALYLLPGWHVEAIEDVNFLAPFKFYRNEPRPVTIHALVHPQKDDLIADCRLTGSRVLPNQAEPQVTTHFTARVRLSKQPPAGIMVRTRLKPVETLVKAAEIYRLYFHGPAYQVVQQAWWDDSHMIGRFANKLPQNHDPSAGPTVIEPRLIELCFQTAGLMEMGDQGHMGLPMQIRQLRWFGAPNGPEGCYAIVTPNSNKEGFDAEVIDAAGRLCLTLVGYRTVALPDGVDATALKVLQEAMSLRPVAV